MLAMATSKWTRWCPTAFFMIANPLLMCVSQFAMNPGPPFSAECWKGFDADGLRTGKKSGKGGPLKGEGKHVCPIKIGTLPPSFEAHNALHVC